MIDRRTLLSGLVALAPASVLGGCGAVANRNRFRVTLEIGIDDRIVSGSSVIEIVIRRNVAPAFTFHDMGVSPIVDLGRNGHLLAMMNGWLNDTQHTYPLARLVAAAVAPENDRSQDFGYLGQVSKTVVAVNRLPILFWIPPGAEQMLQGKMVRQRDLARVVGDGVRYRGILIAPTRDKLITRIADTDISDPPDWLRNRRRDDRMLGGFESDDDGSSEASARSVARAEKERATAK